MDSSLDHETLRYYNQDLIAKTGIQVFFNISNENDFFMKAFSVKETLIKKYPENTVLKNAITYFMTNLKKDTLSEQAKEKRRKIFTELSNSNKRIAHLANTKIKKNSKVFFHSINNNIFEITKNNEKKYFIHLLEHPQHNINKIFYENIKENAKIFPDLSLKDAIKNTDICFFGAEAIHPDHVIVKKGSSIIAKEAKENHIPVYVCASSWKFTNEDNTNSEVFDKLENKDITGIIMEHGIFNPKDLKEEIAFLTKTRR